MPETFKEFKKLVNGGLNKLYRIGTAEEFNLVERTDMDIIFQGAVLKIYVHPLSYGTVRRDFKIINT